MRTLITGASGFLGKNLIKYLKEHRPDLEIIGLTRQRYTSYSLCDIVHEERVRDVMELWKPEIIIHLAANPRGNAGPAVMDDNVKGTFNLVHHAPKNCHFIFASSIVVYGNPNDNYGQKELAPTSLYGLSKQLAENIIDRYERLGKINKTTLRLSAIIGNNLTHGFIYDLVKKIKSDGDYLELFGNSPGSIKPFVHMDDVCEAINFVIKNKLYNVYNVCPNDNISVKEVAEIGLEKFKSSKIIKWLGESSIWEGDNRILSANNYRLKYTCFNFKYKTSREAIEEYFNELVV